MTSVKQPSKFSLMAWQIWLPLVLIVTWFLVSANSTSPFWPPLTSIFAAMGEWAASGALWQDFLFSFGNYIVGVGIAVVLGLGFGVAIGLMPRLARVLDPFLDFLRSLPNVVFVPIIVLVLGIDAWPKIALIAFACMWPVLLNCIEGVRQIAPSIFEATLAYRIPLWLKIRKVVLPGSLPQIVVGVRLAITVGLVMLVVSEMYGSTSGMGFFILDNSQRFRLADAWAGTILIGVIGWLITYVYAKFEHRMLAWHRQEDIKERAS